MCTGWAEAFLSDPQELVTQQETAAPLSVEQLAALNQYIAQLAIPMPRDVLENAAATCDKGATADPDDEGEGKLKETQAPADDLLALTQRGVYVPMTPEQMLYYCFSLWYLSSGEAGDQVAQFAPAQTQQQLPAAGETADTDSAEIASSNATQHLEQVVLESGVAAANDVSLRSSSPSARATPPAEVPQAAPSPCSVSEPFAVDSALSLSSVTAADSVSSCVSQPSTNSPPEQSSSPAPAESLCSSVAPESSAYLSVQQQQLQHEQDQSTQALSFGVFHNGTLYFGAEAARIAAKVLNQGAPAPPVPSLYYCESLGSPLALAAASQMGNVFFSGAASNASTVVASAPYFEAYTDTETFDQQLQRLNLRAAGSSFGDSGSLPLLTA